MGDNVKDSSADAASGGEEPEAPPNLLICLLPPAPQLTWGDWTALRVRYRPPSNRWFEGAMKGGCAWVLRPLPFHNLGVALDVVNSRLKAANLDPFCIPPRNATILRRGGCGGEFPPLRLTPKGDRG